MVSGPGSGCGATDTAAQDHLQPESSAHLCAARELTFSNQLTNCRKWNTQYGCSFAEIYGVRMAIKWMKRRTK